MRGFKDEDAECRSETAPLLFTSSLRLVQFKTFAAAFTQYQPNCVDQVFLFWLEMLRPQVWVLLVVLCLSELLVAGGGAQVTETLREDFVKDQAPTRLLFLRFVSELMASRGEGTLRELEEEELGGRERLRRRHLRFRQRKAGCRNFWKSFTAC